MSIWSLPETRNPVKPESRSDPIAHVLRYLWLTCVCNVAHVVIWLVVWW